MIPQSKAFIKAEKRDVSRSEQRCGIMGYMNRLVRQVAKGIRYRPLPELMAHRIPIRSLDTVVEDTSAWLAQKVPWQIRFQGPEQKYMGFSVVKYGILDLTFCGDGITAYSGLDRS